MTKKYLYIIPLFLLEVMIQLGFFWLAPMNDCRWVVYSFLTVMTIAHFVITFKIMAQHGVRKSIATVVSGSVIQLIIIGATILLLMVGATIRSSLFLLLMLMTLYIAVIVILWISIEGFGSNVNHFSHTEHNDDEDDYDDYTGRDCREYSESAQERVSLPTVRTRNYNTNTTNNNSSRSIARRTPPPIPVKH